MAQTDRLAGLVGNVAIKAPCDVATTANITLNGEQTIDGVVTSASRVLVKNQTNPINNGIYLSDSGAWSRTADFDGVRDVAQGTLVLVNGGTAGAGFWYVSTTGNPTPGTDAISFGQSSAVLALISTFMQSFLQQTTQSGARSAIGAGDMNSDGTVVMTGNLQMGAGTKLVMEGSTDDAFEGTIDPGNPTADWTWLFPNKGGTIAMTSDITSNQIQPITATVATNAMTIGSSAPSLDFRSATAGSGTVTAVTTPPSNLVIPSGQAVGTSNGIAARLWVVEILNAGVRELAVINTQLGNGQIAPVDESQLISTTAIAAAPSAGVFYSTTARSNVPFRIVGFVESTQATAGTWATSPSKIQGMGPGVAKPGETIQVQRSVTGAVATGTTTIPADDTIPQNTEGDQYLSKAITPTSALNTLLIESLGNWQTASGGGTTITALFQDSTASALAATYTANGAGLIAKIPTNHIMQAGTESATTFKIRAGNNSSGTTTFNGASSARVLGGVLNSYLQIVEVMA